MRVATAALLYFCVVFAAGFVFGPIRVLLLEPRFGPAIATLCEAPCLAVVMMIAASRIPRFLHLPLTRNTLLGMGLEALALQQIAEFCFGVFLRGLTPREHFAHFATPAGLIYAAMLLVFVLMPLLRNPRPPAG